MQRRHFLAGVLVAGSALALPFHLKGASSSKSGKITPIERSQAEWRKLLTDAQYHVLRDAGTEPPGTSRLNDEKREGTYTCAGCDLELFESAKKYESGTGWPSFWASIEGHMETSIDFHLVYPRTEYHCARCGGHQGHIFDDGPKPTGKRWCNNGVALTFVPKIA